MPANNKLDWADIVVFTLTLVISLGIGVVFAVTGQHTTIDFLMGNHQLRLIPVALSMYMSTASAIAILGTSAEMYQFGTQAIMSIFGYIGAYLLSAFLVVPVIYPLKLVSSFEVRNLKFTLI